MWDMIDSLMIQNVYTLFHCIFYHCLNPDFKIWQDGCNISPITEKKANGG